MSLPGREDAQHEAFCEVGEFTHVPGPVVRHEVLTDRGRHVGDIAMKAARGVAEIVCEEQRDVFAALA